MPRILIRAALPNWKSIGECFTRSDAGKADPRYTPLWHWHIAVMLLLPGLCVCAVVGKLSIEPGMQSCNQCGVRCSITQLPSPIDISVRGRNFAGLCRLELREPRHVAPMDMRGPREIAPLKLGLDLAQVLLHPLNLPGIRAILSDDSLRTPVSGFCKNMRCGRGTGHT